MKQFIRCRGCGLRLRLDPKDCPYVCACGRLVSAEGKTLKAPTPPSKPRGPCDHLGPSTRQQECDTCAGKTRIKIFACAIHGECTLAKPLPSLACCAGCGEYEAVLPKP